MKKGIAITLFLLSCAYGIPVILQTKENKTRPSNLHALTDDENNVTVRALESQLSWNNTEHLLNSTNNETFIINVMSLAEPIPYGRFQCRLSICLVTNLGSSLQYGDTEAGELTKDPAGIGKK